MERYRELECHFNWDIRSIIGDKEIVDKLSEKIEEIAGQPWRNLLISLTLAYELHVKKDSGANEKLQEVITMWGNIDDDFIMRYKDAFRHVIFSTKLFFVKNKSSDNIIKEIFNYIPAYTTLPTEQKAAITAIKAHVFSEYGTEGTKYALTLAKEAVRENPQEGEWSFLVGKMLSRIRQFTLDFCITEEELECLRHAYNLSKSPAHAVFLAQTYCTISKALYHKLPISKGKRILNDNEGRIIRGYNEKAYNLFNEALKANDNKCIHMNFRCARGLFYLPGEFKSVDKALDIVEKTLERAPTNIYGNSIAANIYYAIKQYDKAFKHIDAAEEGGAYGASIKKFQMNVELKRAMNSEQAYEDIFKKHPEAIFRIQTAMHAITYYLFKKKNLFLALKYFFKAANWDATLDSFYYYIYWIGESTDVCFIVYNEVKSAIEGNRAKNTKQLKQLRDVITVINTKYPQVTERKLQPNLVEFLLKRCRRFPQRNNLRKPNNKNQQNKVDSSNNNDKTISNNNEKINKVNKKSNSRNSRRRTSRTRTESECSNVSAASASSCASASSFTRIRRNSKEACLLDIISKDLEISNRCKELKEANKTTETTLRPCQEKNQLLLGFKPKEKNPLSMGCSGWSSKSQSNENLSSLNRSRNENKKYTPQKDNKNSQEDRYFNSMKTGISTPRYRRQNKSFSASEDENKSSVRTQGSLNMGCSGWRSKSQSNENLIFHSKSSSYNQSTTYTPRQDDKISHLNQSFNRLKIEAPSPGQDKQNKTPFSLEHERPSNTRIQRSLSSCSDGAVGLNICDSKSESGIYRKNTDKVNYDKNKSCYKDGNYRENKQYVGKYQGRESSERDNFGRGYNNQKRNYGCNSGRGKNYSNKEPNNRTLIRKPFNLNREDSLDSDDSVLSHRENSDGNVDRLSISSVDSDYVWDSSKPYFPWHGRRGAYKK